MKKEIFYWGPFLDDGVATVKAMLNSAQGINRYSKEYKTTIINAVGEWDKIKEKNLDHLVFCDLGINLYKSLPRFSYLKSRMSYIIIFFRCFINLKNLIKKKTPEYLIIHLIVSLPMLIFLLFNFKTKLCLRISGQPKFNFLRKLFWKIAGKKIDKIFCPTVGTYNNLIENNIFDKDKIAVLYDPVFKIEDIHNLSKEKNLDKKFVENNIILIGRLTKQKNFELIIKVFSELKNIYPNTHINILGEGELRPSLEKLIKFYNLENRIKLLGFKNNVYKYLTKSKIFILSSLWEDPGFVLIEAGICQTTILASDCPNGPKEFLQNEKGGYLFENDSADSLSEKLNYALNESKTELIKKKINSKKNSLNYSFFRHYKKLEQLLQ